MKHRAAINVGAGLGPLGAPAITRTVLARFAAATGDSNAIHLDPRVASRYPTHRPT